MWSWPLFGAAAFLVCAVACMALAASQRKVRQPWHLLAVLGAVCLAGCLWAAGNEILGRGGESDARVRIGALVLAVWSLWLAIESLIVFLSRRPSAGGSEHIVEAIQNEPEQP
jgi:hypothetical protein